jgi:hypothetical protein
MSRTGLSLDDMPEEIVLEIADILLDDGYPPSKRAMGFRKLGYHCTEDEADPFVVFHTRQGRNVLALSECCRWLRSIIFARNLLKGLTIRPCDRDLSVIIGWKEETRAWVK